LGAGLRHLKNERFETGIAKKPGLGFHTALS